MLAAVTGANGFIGSNLVCALADRGWRVRALTRAPSTDFGTRDHVDCLTVNYANERDIASALDGADVVFHAAGATRAASDGALFEANVGLTSRLLRATSGAARFVFLSSQAAAGAAASAEQPRTEDDLSEPVGQYGRSKLEAERLVAKRDGAVILRPAAVYGPRDRDFLQLFRLATRGVAVHPANRNCGLSTVNVDDLVKALILAATSSAAPDQTYFIASDEITTWGNVFRIAALAASRKLAIDVEVPTVLVNSVARLGDLHARWTGRVSLLTTHKAELSGPRHWVCSNARAKSELGFKPTVRLEDGMRSTYQWYIDHGWLVA